MKVTLNGVGSLIDATTAQNTINANTQTISNAFDNTLSLDGTQPNQMKSEFDMNSHQILNLPVPATANSPLRLQDLSNFTGGGAVSNIPVGGTTGQVLGKNSNTNYDTGWKNSVTSVGLALPADLTVTNSPVTTTGTLTGAWATTPTGTGAMVRAVAPVITGHPTIEGVTSTGATGTGNMVFDTAPTLTTPNIGVATATTVNKLTLTAPATSATLTIPNGVTVTGFAASDTMVGKASTDTLTNKTYDTAGTGNSLSIAGVAVTANTGTGAIARATSPTFVTPVLGTPASATLTNATGLPLSGLTTQGAFTFAGNNTSGAASPTAVDIAALTAKASPVATDLIMISDQAASGAWKKATVSSIASAGSVSSIAGNTGAFTLSNGITNLVNDIRINAGQVPGTTTNDNAAAGFVGEYKFGGTASGGLTQATVTISNASPGVITWTAHGFTDYSPVYFTTTGALPTGFSPSTAYYVVPGSQAANTFQLAATIGGAAINTSSAGSGTHTGVNAIPTSNGGTTQNVTALVLTAGDWDVSATGLTAGASTTNVTYVLFGLTATSATLDTSGGRETLYPKIATPFSGGGGIGLSIPSARFSLAGTTTIFMVVNTVFDTSTMSTYGSLHARRMR